MKYYDVYNDSIFNETPLIDFLGLIILEVKQTFNKCERDRSDPIGASA